jgi:CDP-diacylglycerol---serine O-phosphatidyltransferase
LTKISFLPSIFTIFSLFLGFLALLQIFKGKAGNFQNAVFLIAGSVVMDGFDGTVARLTKTESNFGVQLDSLVDAVTFGLVPSVMIYMWGFQQTGAQYGKIIGFIFLTAGVVRLARFNVLKEANAVPSNIFVGLPIPLGALAIVSAVLMHEAPLQSQHEILLFSLYVILISLLMVSTIKYRTMKKIKSKNSLLILLCVAIIIAFAINYPHITLPGLACLYIISPILFYIYFKFRKNKPPVFPVENSNSNTNSHTNVNVPGKEGEL